MSRNPVDAPNEVVSQSAHGYVLAITAEPLLERPILIKRKQIVSVRWSRFVNTFHRFLLGIKILLYSHHTLYRVTLGISSYKILNVRFIKKKNSP